MQIVGIRELKSQLSARLKRVQAGARLTVTDRGRPIATIVPAEPVPDIAWASRLAAAGGVSWSGGKPQGLRQRVASRGRTASRVVIDDRR